MFSYNYAYAMLLRLKNEESVFVGAIVSNVNRANPV